ncbi:hypothetical protein [Hymenobacter persicinus]|uniref:Uncharacterized protein n=1 Tax=Hymenobacter persicinus TaxID=2025506 RepID=A0A4V1ZB44_9BACT|nr:hypothetical protein [Hymenobacter persicinus]RYU82823.1 hypothetical protein EWM57_03810 [Hymenobacter persicinus]
MNKFLVTGLLLVSGLLTACQFDSATVVCEDGTTPGPVLPVPATLQQLYTQLGAPVQTLTYDPSRANTFTGTKGTIVTIPANAFVRNGQLVTAPVQLAFREIFSRADMVLSSMPTVSNGRLLESAGEVYLRAAQDTSIRLSQGATIRLQTPTPANVASRDSMRLFAGPTGTGAACFNWTLNTDPGSYLTPNSNGYTITVGSVLYNSGVGWFNCDRFYSSPNPQSITVNVTGNNIDPEKNTMVFAVFRTFNGSLRICDFTAPGTFRSGGVPLGTPVSVAVIRTDGGKLYYGRQDGTVQANSPFTPTLKETTPAALVADLNLL